MRDEPNRRWLEWLKSLLILLLLVSAAYLLTQTSLTGQPLSSLLPGSSGPAPGATEDQGGFVRPVRMAIMSDKPGRYGIQYDQDAMDATFGGALLNLVSDALSGAGTPRSVTARVWLDALASSAHPGVYLDFLGAVPCANLPVWLGGRDPNPQLVGETRRLLLTVDSAGAATLYYSGASDDAYYACATSPDLGERLTAAVAEFEPNGARFAFEDPSHYADLAPETLILTQVAAPRVYSSTNPIPAGSDAARALIQALTFHPQANLSDMTDLPIREGSDTLRIDTSGAVSYYSASAEDPRFPVGQGEDSLSEAEMVNAAWALLHSSMGNSTGAARLYLIGLGQEGSDTVAYFGYQLDGVSVQVGGEGYAARIAFQEGRISAFTLQMRRYEETGATSVVLPEAQAAAAMRAKEVPGSELILCYLDQGGEVKAGWIAA